MTHSCHLRPVARPYPERCEPGCLMRGKAAPLRRRGLARARRHCARDSGTSLRVSRAAFVARRSFVVRRSSASGDCTTARRATPGRGPRSRPNRVLSGEVGGPQAWCSGRSHSNSRIWPSSRPRSSCSCSGSLQRRAGADRVAAGAEVQAEWHRTFGREHVGTSQRTKVGQPRAASCAGADGWPHPGSATPFLSFSCPSATNRLAVV